MSIEGRVKSRDGVFHGKWRDSSVTRTGDNIRARLFERRSGGELDALLAAVEEAVEAGEELQYQFSGTDGLTFEREDGTEESPAAADGSSVAVVTDTSLTVAVETPNGIITERIPYTNVRSVELHDGMLTSTRLEVEIWPAGVYRFSPAGDDSLQLAVEYVERVSDCWQRVVGFLEDALEHAQTVGEAIEEGRSDDAEAARDAVAGKFDRAATKIETNGTGASAALTARLREVRHRYYRIRLEARRERAERLMRAGKEYTEARQYDEAHRRYTDARTQLERALVLDIEQGFEEGQPIQERIDEIDSRVRNLSVRPMALGHQASERAEGTDQLDIEVQAWQDALDHYRDALTLGWGTDLRFTDDREGLRERIEEVVENLVTARRQLAVVLVEDGEKYSDAGDLDTATDRVEMAHNQLEAAEKLASQYRAGDVEAIRNQRAALPDST